ncbi:MAG TPA: tape measure protein [Gammaproteobacteria bacterium]|nr:tape measure protein [Chromatiaceae bacterium]HPE81003.1 tape measure protein [Gammaproteobacteria bacterium]
MSDMVLSIKLTGDSSGLTGSINISQKEVKRLAGEFDKAGTSTQRFDREMDRTESTANKLGKSMQRLGHYGAALLAGGFGVRGVSAALKLADSYHTLERRIEAATRVSGNYVVVSEQIHQLSRDNGVALEATVSLFQGLARVRAELGATDDDLLSLTDTLQKAGAIGGSSTSAMAAGMLQFTQAMSAGTVRAEEMNSIVENMPEVALQIAEGLGVTVGELQRAVREGKVLSREVFGALMRQAPQVAEQFEAMGINFGRAGEKFDQSLTAAVAKLDQALGLSASVARNLSAIADEINITTGNAGVRDLAVGIERRRSEIDRLRGQQPTSPLDWLTGPSNAVSVVKLRSEIAELEAELNAKLQARGGVDGLRLRQQALENRIHEIEAELAPTLNQYPEGSRARAVFMDLDPKARELTGLRAQLAEAGKALEDLELSFPQGPSVGGGSVDTARAEKLQSFVAALREERDTLGMNSAELARYEAAKLGADAATQTLVVGLAREIEFRREGEEALDRAIAQQAEMEAAYDQRMAGNQALIASLEVEYQLLQMTDQERAVEVALRRLSADATDEQKARVTELTQAMLDHNQAVADAQEAERSLAAENAAAMRRIDHAVGRTMRAAEDSFIKFVKTGKFEFRSLVDVILDELLSIQFEAGIGSFGGGNGGFGGLGGLLTGVFSGSGTQQATMLADQWSWGDTIASWFGFGDGGVMTRYGPVPLRHYGTGGIVSSPQVRVAGERYQPEAIVPLPDGRAIPVEMRGGEAGLVFSPTYNIDARGADGVSESRIRQAMRETVQLTLNELARQIGQGGAWAKLIGRRA